MTLRDFDKDLSESNKFKPFWTKKLKDVFGDESQVLWKDDKVSQMDFGCDVLVITSK